MERMKISLRTVEDILKFMSITNKYNYDTNVYKDSYIIDGKSFLGMMSLDLRKSIEIELMSNDEASINAFKEDMKQFEVE